MTPILLLSPMQSISDLAPGVAETLGIDIAIETSDDASAREIIQSHPDIEIVVTRGGLAEQARQIPGISVVEISMSLNDLLGQLSQLTSGRIQAHRRRQSRQLVQRRFRRFPNPRRTRQHPAAGGRSRHRAHGPPDGRRRLRSHHRLPRRLRNRARPRRPRDLPRERPDLDPQARSKKPCASSKQRSAKSCRPPN